MLVFVLSFNSIGIAATAADRRGPMAKLFESSRALHGARRIDELGERILTETRTLFRFDEFYFVLVEPGQQILDFRVHERGGVRQPARTKSVNAGLVRLDGGASRAAAHRGLVASAGGAASAGGDRPARKRAR